MVTKARVRSPLRLGTIDPPGNEEAAARFRGARPEGAARAGAWAPGLSRPPRWGKMLGMAAGSPWTAPRPTSRRGAA